MLSLADTRAVSNYSVSEGILADRERLGTVRSSTPRRNYRTGRLIHAISPCKDLTLRVHLTTVPLSTLPHLRLVSQSYLIGFLVMELIHFSLNSIFDIRVIFIMNYSFSENRR
jgi:hypothetical protein